MNTVITFCLTFVCIGSGLLYAIDSSFFMAYLKRFERSGFYYMHRGGIFIHFDHAEFPTDHKEDVSGRDQRHKFLFRMTVIFGIAVIAFRLITR